MSAASAQSTIAQTLANKELLNNFIMEMQMCAMMPGLTLQEFRTDLETRAKEILGEETAARRARGDKLFVTVAQPGPNRLKAVITLRDGVNGASTTFEVICASAPNWKELTGEAVQSTKM